jgi:hypothetical protein
MGTMLATTLPHLLRHPLRLGYPLWLCLLATGFFMRHRRDAVRLGAAQDP